MGLGLTGSVPHDLQKFTTLAHTSYTNAAKAPWAAKMAKRGYPAARLETLKAAVSALAGSESDKAVAAGEKEEDTAARNTACQNLKTYMKEIMGVARGAFRGNPGGLAKLKL